MIEMIMEYAVTGLVWIVGIAVVIFILIQLFKAVMDNL